MIQGIVNARHEAIVPLRVRGPGGMEADIAVIVDTGYTASLTLPMVLVTALGLLRESGTSAVLADGSIRQFEVYSGEVKWDGVWRTVLVSVVGNESLLGMRLLANHKLTIDVAPGGLVEIVPLI